MFDRLSFYEHYLPDVLLTYYFRPNSFYLCIMIFKMAATLAKTAGKIGLAVGVVAVTASQGVWSTNNEMGVKALNKVRNNVLPAANEMFEKVPSREAVKNSTCDKWNSGVKATFSCLSTAPERSANYLTKSIEKLQNSRK